MKTKTENEICECGMNEERHKEPFPSVYACKKFKPKNQSQEQPINRVGQKKDDASAPDIQNHNSPQLVKKSNIRRGHSQSQDASTRKDEVENPVNSETQGSLNKHPDNSPQIRCIADEGIILTSNPPQYRCKNCYNTWVCGEIPLICKRDKIADTNILSKEDKNKILRAIRIKINNSTDKELQEALDWLEFQSQKFPHKIKIKGKTYRYGYQYPSSLSEEQLRGIPLSVKIFNEDVVDDFNNAILRVGDVRASVKRILKKKFEINMSKGINVFDFQEVVLVSDIKSEMGEKLT